MLFKHRLYYGPLFSTDQGSGGGAGASDDSGDGNEGDESNPSGGAADDDSEPDGEDVTGLKNSLKAVRGEKKTLKEQLDAANSELDQLRKQKTDAQRKQDEDAGNWEKIAKDREDEINQLKADAAKRDLDDLKRRVGKHKDFNLPDDLIDLLRGETEDELRAHAKKLAAHVAKQDGPDTDSGKRGNGGGKAPKQESVLANYKFGQRR